MCDWCSWIEKDGKLYFLRDADIEAKWPNAYFQDKIGHSAIKEYYPESKGGKCVESAIKVPKEIAAEIGRGHMDKMIRAGGWTGARYSKAGKLISPWWKKVEAIVKECKAIKYFTNTGTVNPEWQIFNTRDAARDAAWYAAGDAAMYAAGNAAGDAAMYAAGNAARDAAWYAAMYAAVDAARYAAGNAAGDAAMYAAGNAAENAAGNAARDAARYAAWYAAGDAAMYAAGNAAENAAWYAARDAARYAARNAAEDAALLARCEIAEFLDNNQFKIHAQKRMDVWRAGYGLLCDVDGILYVYKKL